MLDSGIYAEVAEITGRTLLVSGAALAFAVLLGVPAGVALAVRRSFPGRGLVMALVNTGMGLPPVVVGLIVALALFRGGPLGGLEWMYTIRAMVLAQAIIAFPLVMGFTAAGVQQLDPNLALQLKSLGVRGPRLGWILLREARLSALAAVMAGFGGAISEVGASMMVGGNLAGETRVLTTAVMLEVSRGDFPVAMALSIILLVLIFIVNAILTAVQQQEKM
jgi:tungstate transport system permease protein